MTKTPRQIWVTPKSTRTEYNVWVMVSQVVVRGNTLCSLRVFSTEPTQATIDYQKKALCSDPEAVSVEIFETLPDHFDDDEFTVMDA
jgi:hypothetical protein